jgi:hypothetical protein
VALQAIVRYAEASKTMSISAVGKPSVCRRRRRRDHIWHWVYGRAQRMLFLIIIDNAPIFTNLPQCRNRYFVHTFFFNRPFFYLYCWNRMQLPFLELDRSINGFTRPAACEHPGWFPRRGSVERLPKSGCGAESHVFIEERLSRSLIQCVAKFFPPFWA